MSAKKKVHQKYFSTKTFFAQFFFAENKFLSKKILQNKYFAWKKGLPKKSQGRVININAISRQSQDKGKESWRKGQGKFKVISRQGKTKVKVMWREGQGKVKVRSRQGQGKVKVRLRQRKHNLDLNYNSMGFDTIEINLSSILLFISWKARILSSYWSLYSHLVIRLKAILT